MNPIGTKAPKKTAGVVVELSSTLRAVIYGHHGSTILLRGADVFVLNDVEAAKLDAGRADYLSNPTAPGKPA